jgi:hypothetical protein
LSNVFPDRSLPFLTLAANVGLILYMFLVGLELTPGGKFGGHVRIETRAQASLYK